MEWFFLVMFVVSFLAIYLVIRKDTNNKSLTRRGFIKLIIMFVAIFVISFGVVYFTR